MSGITGFLAMTTNTISQKEKYWCMQAHQNIYQKDGEEGFENTSYLFAFKNKSTIANEKSLSVKPCLFVTLLIGSSYYCAHFVSFSSNTLTFSHKETL